MSTILLQQQAQTFTLARATTAHSQPPVQTLAKLNQPAVALALKAMGDKFQAILDVTIVYPDGAPKFGEFLAGKVKRITVRVRSIPVPQNLAQGDYANDPAIREAYQKWVHQMWLDKDAQIEALLLASTARQ